MKDLLKAIGGSQGTNVGGPWQNVGGSLKLWGYGGEEGGGGLESFGEG